MYTRRLATSDQMSKEEGEYIDPERSPTTPPPTTPNAPPIPPRQAGRPQRSPVSFVPCLYVQMYMCTYMYMCTHVLYVHIHVCTCIVYVHVHVYVYIHVYTCIVCTHIYMYVHVLYMYSISVGKRIHNMLINLPGIYYTVELLSSLCHTLNTCTLLSID